MMTVSWRAITANVAEKLRESMSKKAPSHNRPVVPRTRPKINTVTYAKDNDAIVR